jgi:small subunit ribosomal protein S3Ae
MAVGKSKKQVKGGRKGLKKKAGHPMARKDWYDVIAPVVFDETDKNRQFAKTCVNKSQGTKLSADFLKGRVYEVSYGDLTKDEERAHKKFKLECLDTQGRNCVTQFYGMDTTTDKQRSLFKKWCTTIEAQTTVKTTDGYLLRLFCIGFTKRKKNQVKKNCYAKASQVRAIRAKMVELMKKAADKQDLSSLVKALINDTISRDIERACTCYHPLRDKEVHIRKAKLIRQPKYDAAKLMEAHGGKLPVSLEEQGRAVEE